MNSLSIILAICFQLLSSKTQFLAAVNASVLLVVMSGASDATITSGHSGYLIGGIIALMILGYLIYSLIRPEKF
jgi:K+-transporting ATPase KdpF subunit